MDQERVSEAHPAFPIIIKQLSSDEAVVLASLDGTEYDFVFTQP
jgi:Abortive infection alpha